MGPRTIKLYGFFKELSHGDVNGGSLPSKVRPVAGKDEAKIVRYLETASNFAACGGPAVDILSADRRLICPPHIMTDGVWMWSLDLAYYIKKYHVEIPAEFHVHMAAQNFIPPKLTVDEVMQLRDAERVVFS